MNLTCLVLLFFFVESQIMRQYFLSSSFDFQKNKGSEITFFQQDYEDLFHSQSKSETRISLKHFSIVRYNTKTKVITSANEKGETYPKVKKTSSTNRSVRISSIT